MDATTYLTRQDRDFIDNVCRDVYDHAFTMLDAVPELTGDDAGDIALAASSAARAKLETLLSADR